MLIGEGSNGKDTLGAAMAATLGTSTMFSATPALFANYDQGRMFGLYGLRHSRLTWISEADPHFRVLESGSVQTAGVWVSG